MNVTHQCFSILFTDMAVLRPSMEPMRCSMKIRQRVAQQMQVLLQRSTTQSGRPEVECQLSSCSRRRTKIRHAGLAGNVAGAQASKYVVPSLNDQ